MPLLQVKNISIRCLWKLVQNLTILLKNSWSTWIICLISFLSSVLRLPFPRILFSLNLRKRCLEMRKFLRKRCSEMRKVYIYDEYGDLVFFGCVVDDIELDRVIRKNAYNHDIFSIEVMEAV